MEAEMTPPRALTGSRSGGYGAMDDTSWGRGTRADEEAGGDVVSMADSTATLEDLEEELVRIERLREQLDGRHAAVPGDLASQGGAAGPGLPPRRGARGQRGACPGGVAHQDDPRAGGEEGLPGGRRGAREAQGARGGQGDVGFPAEEAQEEGAAIASRRGAGGGPPGERGVPAGKADVRQDRPHPPQGLLRPGLLLRAVTSRGDSARVGSGKARVQACVCG
ncbi:bMERB domain-containing protein 1 isoform X1 [Lampetra fluviatilis]